MATSDIRLPNDKRLPVDTSAVGSIRDVLLQLSYRLVLPTTCMKLVTLAGVKLDVEDRVPGVANVIISYSKLREAQFAAAAYVNRFADLESKRTLAVGSRQLVELPDAIGQLAALQKLDVQSNQLTAVPDTIGQLAALEVLDLQSNQQTAVPGTIDQLPGTVPPRR